MWVYQGLISKYAQGLLLSRVIKAIFPVVRHNNWPVMRPESIKVGLCDTQYFDYALNMRKASFCHV